MFVVEVGALFTAALGIHAAFAGGGDAPAGFTLAVSAWLWFTVLFEQTLITRGALTTFSLASDLAKYFAIIPAAFAATYPALGALDVMRLHSPQSAVLSAVIFNALIIVALIPLALRGVRYRAAPARQLLRSNLLTYGLGGVLLPFPCIKLIDLALTALGGV
jgi:K+-transporting ATPase ATPase B chain